MEMTAFRRSLRIVMLRTSIRFRYLARYVAPAMRNSETSPSFENTLTLVNPLGSICAKPKLFQMRTLPRPNQQTTLNKALQIISFT